jgi:hypothetical protein
MEKSYNLGDAYRCSKLAQIMFTIDLAEATKQLVSSELLGRSGLYFNGLNEAKATPQAYDAAVRTQLRTLSFELTGLAHNRSSPAVPAGAAIA